MWWHCEKTLDLVKGKKGGSGGGLELGAVRVRDRPSRFTNSGKDSRGNGWNCRALSRYSGRGFRRRRRQRVE